MSESIEETPLEETPRHAAKLTLKDRLWLAGQYAKKFIAPVLGVIGAATVLVVANHGQRLDELEAEALSYQPEITAVEGEVVEIGSGDDTTS